MSVLRLLAECGRVSRRTFDILPYHYRNTCSHIKDLVDGKYILPSGVGNSKCYILLDNGRTTLSATNPQRYTPELFAYNRVLYKHADRSRLRGDAAAMISLAGFAVHPDDKPPLPAVTPTPPDHQYSGLHSLYQNHEPQHYGQIIPDRAVYSKRLTPVNCYYDSTALKKLRMPKDVKGVNYSRACGVLFTPSTLLRVYHSRDVAMRFFKTGEDNLSALLSAAFTGYIPGNRHGALVFGQGWLAANSVLDNHLRMKTIAPLKDADIPGDILNPANLGKPLFYLPLRSEALELLRLMRYPDWHKSLMLFASDTHAQIEQTNWAYQHEGRRVCIVADLNLTNLSSLLRDMMKNPRAPVTLLCLSWQRDFIFELVKEYGCENTNAEIVLLHDSFMNDLINNHMKPYWG